MNSRKEFDTPSKHCRTFVGFYGIPAWSNEKTGRLRSPGEMRRSLQQDREARIDMVLSPLTKDVLYIRSFRNMKPKE